jgi:hypothetical protein
MWNDQNKRIALVLSGIFILQAFLIFKSSGIYGGADNINHFRIARFAWVHPWLLLDHWGKPVFTVLLLPFTLFGIQVARLFNVAVGLVTIVFTLRLIKGDNKYQGFVPIVFIAFSPMYFLLMQSCLTEILFSLVLILSVWLFLRNNSIGAAIMLSFIPFVRTEGIVVWPIFLIAFIGCKNYRAIPFLLIGSLFYSVVGYFHYHDWLWIYHEMPYSMGKSIYGSGSLFHFILESPQIFGEPFLIFLVLGLIRWTIQIVKSRKFSGDAFWTYWLVTGSFVVFFAAHSYVWWKGTGGSLGLIRVIAGVIPLGAIIATNGFLGVLSAIKRNVYQNVCMGSVIVLQTIIPFLQHRLPVRLEPTQELIAKSANYIKQLDNPSKIYYFDPYLVHFLKLDPFDQERSNWGVADKVQPSNTMNVGDILVWDAHFGPNEGGVKLTDLLADPYLQSIKVFFPKEKFTVLGGYEYAVYVFCKVQNKTVSEQKPAIIRSLTFDNPGMEHCLIIDNKTVFRLDSSVEYSPAIRVPLQEVAYHDYIDLQASVSFLPQELISSDEVLLVVSIDLDGKPVSYNKVELVAASENIGSWQALSLPLKIAVDFPERAVISVYVWNKEKKSLLLDNLQININGV